MDPAGGFFKAHVFHPDFLTQIQAQKAYIERIKPRGLDPEPGIEQGFSDTLVERVQTMFKQKGLSSAIKTCYPQSNRIQLTKDVIEVLLRRYDHLDVEKKFERILRIVLAIYTEGVVTAPIDGMDPITIDPVDRFVRINFAGPIRAAGGSICGLIVLTAEYLRNKLGLNRYNPTKQEIDRGVAECLAYVRKHPSSIKPSAPELRLILEKAPIMIDGSESEVEQVPVYKYLPRLNKPRIRSGFALVVSEGLFIRAKKLLPIAKELGVESDWIEELIELGKSLRPINAKETVEKESKYSLTIGRPVLSDGDPRGLKLRIGSTPTTALCGSNVHPKFIKLIKFINIGSQLIMNTPGKGTTITGTCQDLKPPIIRYKDGVRQYDGHDDDVVQVLDLGQILFNAGEFIQYNRVLPVRDYCNGLFRTHTDYQVDPCTVSQSDAIALCKSYKYAKLPPKFALYLNNLTFEQYKLLRLHYQSHRSFNINDKRMMDLLHKMVVPYSINEEHVVLTYESVFEYYMFKTPLSQLSFVEYDEYTAQHPPLPNHKSALIQYFNRYLQKSGCTLIPEIGFFSVFARVGRVQNISLTQMKQKGAVKKIHSLCSYKPNSVSKTFFQQVLKQKYGYCKYKLRYCIGCKLENCYSTCQRCGARAYLFVYCKSCDSYYEESSFEDKDHVDHYVRTTIEVKRNYQKQLEDVAMLELLKNETVIDYSKRFRCATTSVPYPESLVKGLLRAKHDLTVSKDGTFRVIAPNLCTTHFKPSEIGVTVDDLRKLGYDTDQIGRPIHSDSIVPLKMNDVIVSYQVADIIKRGCNFIDAVIRLCYDQSHSYYDVKDYVDLLGVSLFSISPHTSCAPVNRIIGFTSNRGVYAHPVLIAARRRDQDGDIDAYGLLLDLYLNGSMNYTQKGKTGALMSVPINLAQNFTLKQVGKQIIEREVYWDYYGSKGLNNLVPHSPSDLKKLKRLESMMDLNVRPTDFAYNTPGFSINNHTTFNLYTQLNDTTAKIDRVIELIKIISNVNNLDCVIGLIQGHLLPDIIGNTNAFFRQKLKCSNCGNQYTINPLQSTCHKCNIGKLKLTVYPGMTTKYVRTIDVLESKFKLPASLSERIYNIKKGLNQVFETRRDGPKLKGILDSL